MYMLCLKERWPLNGSLGFLSPNMVPPRTGFCFGSLSLSRKLFGSLGESPTFGDKPETGMIFCSVGEAPGLEEEGVLSDVLSASFSLVLFHLCSF